MKILILITISLLSGCSLLTRTVEVPVPTKIKIVCDKEIIKPIQTLSVKWQLGRNENDMFVIALDGKAYSNLAINMGRVTEYIISIKEYNEYLENCIDKFNK